VTAPLADSARVSAPSANLAQTALLPGGLVAALRPLDPDAPWIGAWERLGAGAAIANPFYEAGYALAAAAAFGAGVRMMLVADRPPEEPGARLLAAWPHRRVRHRWGVPLSALVGWTHGYAPQGAPLLDGAHPGAALNALLAAPRALGQPRRLLLQNAPTADLIPLIEGAGIRSAAYWPHDRGMLDPARDCPEARSRYLDHLSGNRRRRLRRARRRLEAEGAVAFDLLSDPAAVLAALEAHIALEAASWKGRVGTALAQRPAEAEFLRTAIVALAAEGRVRIARLRRGERLLASAILPLAGREACVLKVAHDETDPAAAPGVQLVHRLTEAVLAGGEIARIDSCAPPGFALATLFWRERRSIAHLLVEAGRDPFFPAAARLERGRETLARLKLRLKERRQDTRAPTTDADG
jgi:CelD/BcsL family acetyltransferase involved in cellulose biosynthesis